MSKKITISVPDFLHDKIEKWRGSFNLSRIFQEAVSEAIKKKEELGIHLKKEINIPEIVERLKKEKKESEKKYFEEGEKSGLEWASRAHYQDLKKALHHPVESLMKQGENFHNYFRTVLGNIKKQYENEEDSGKYHRLFLAGWKQGVKNFWDSIKGKLEED